VNLLSISGWLESAKFWESEICEILESGICEVLESGIYEVREYGKVLIREPRRAVIFVNKRFGGQEEAKSKTSPQNFGFMCELVTDL
jgi:hypothetical protein